MKKSILLNLFLLISFILVITISKDLILSCGIFAYLGNNPKKHFNWDKFNILGVFNDSRGGDACGLITHGYYETVYKTGIVHYKDAIIDKTIKPDVMPIDHVIGHTRRASSGGYKEMYTQPYVITKNHSLNKSKISKNREYKTWSTSLPPNSILFSGVHNGTIHNIRELANKHDIKIKNQNDTQILFDILFKKEYKVLESYIGTASLVWHDYYEDCTYVFRGESAVTEHYKYKGEERPLFMWNVDETNMYISSIRNSLYFIGADPKDVSEVPANTIFKIHDGKTIEKIIINRDKTTQKETYNNSNNRSAPYYGNDDNQWWDKHNKRLAAKATNQNFSHNIDNDSPGYEEEEQGLIQASLRYMAVKYENVSHPSKLRLSLEDNPNFYHRHKNNSIIYSKGRYWVGNNLAHGIYASDPFGKLAHIKTVYQNEFSYLKLYYFVEGFRIFTVSDYFLTKELCRGLHTTYFKQKHKIRAIDVVQYELDLMTNVAPFTSIPFVSLIDYDTTGFEGAIYKTYTTLSEDKTLSAEIQKYSGLVRAPFAKRTYEVNQGDLIKINNQQPALPHHNRETHKQTMEYLRDQSKLFTKTNTGDSGYKSDMYDKIGLAYYHDDRIFSKPDNYTPSMLSQILNRHLEVIDCNTYHPHTQTNKIGFTTDNKAKSAIKNVATALMVHFKTFYGDRYSCLSCKKSDYINEDCFQCYIKREYFLNVVHHNNNIK